MNNKYIYNILIYLITCNIYDLLFANENLKQKYQKYISSKIKKNNSTIQIILNKKELILVPKELNNITKIIIYTSNEKAKQSLTDITSHILNKSNSIQNRNIIKKTIQRWLKENGFAASSINIFSIKGIKGYTLGIKINDFKELKITNIYLDTDTKINLNKYYGTSAKDNNIRHISKAIRSKLIALGYVESKAKTKKIDIDYKENSVSLFIESNLGPRRIITFNIIGGNKNIKKITDNILENNNFKVIKNTESIKKYVKQNLTSHGYYDSIIRTKTTNDLITKTIKVTIVPGKKRELKSIVFNKNNYFTNTQLIEYIMEKNIISTKESITEEKIRKVTDLLASLYKRNGFWDISIKVSKKNTKKGTDLIFNISEGKVRILHDINFYGDLSQREVKELYAMLKDNVSQKISIKNREELKNKIIKFYQDKNIYVESDSIKFSSSVFKNIKKEVLIEYNFRIKKPVKFKLYSVRISGNTQIKSSTIMNYIYLKKGRYYSNDDLRDQRKKLLHTRLFKKVNISKNEKESRLGGTEITVNVEEGQTGNIMFGPGYNLNKGLYFGSQLSEKVYFLVIRV